MKSNAVVKIISAIVNFFSILSLAFVPNMPKWIIGCISVIAIACLLFLVYQAINSSRINEVVCKNNEEINNAMKELIKEQGKVCIMSRALSWVDDEIIGIMSKKKSNLVIYAEAENETTKKLEKEGVNVKFYGKTGFRPKTRFTIVRFTRANPQISIADNKGRRGKKDTGHHIYHTSPDIQNDNYIVSLAVDMANLMEKVCD